MRTPQSAAGVRAWSAHPAYADAIGNATARAIATGLDHQVIGVPGDPATIAVVSAEFPYIGPPADLVLLATAHPHGITYHGPDADERKPARHRPCIDHSLLSPSGRVSKRARRAAEQREFARLFPPGFWDRPEPTEAEARAAEALSLRRHAATLRDLAARGMSRRKFTRAAAALEAEAATLAPEGETP